MNMAEWWISGTENRVNYKFRPTIPRWHPFVWAFMLSHPLNRLDRCTCMRLCHRHQKAGFSFLILINWFDKELPQFDTDDGISKILIDSFSYQWNISRKNGRHDRYDEHNIDRICTNLERKKEYWIDRCKCTEIKLAQTERKIYKENRQIDMNRGQILC